jgi:ketosteroid isomerase-like protein
MNKARVSQMVLSSVVLFLLLVSLSFGAPPVATSGLGQQSEPAAVEIPSVNLPDALDRVLRDYEVAWRSRDADALASLFTGDGFVLSPGRPPVRGRDAIRQRYQGSGGELALRALAFGIEGSIAYIIGGYARQMGEPDIGKFTLTLRLGEDGRWLIHSDMDNGNSRP